MEAVSFWTPISFHDQSKTCKQKAIEWSDQYLSFGKKVCKVDNGIVRIATQSRRGWVVTLLKISSYLTVILPLLALCTKALLRPRLTISPPPIETSKSQRAFNLDLENPHKRDKNGLTQVHFAAIHGDEEALESLHKLGANLNVRDCFSRTPVHYAAFHGQLGAIEKLHELGASLNPFTPAGMTPAHIAALKGDTELLRTLHECGADLSAENRFGATPHRVAMLKNHTEFSELLQEILAQKPQKMKIRA